MHIAPSEAMTDTTSFSDEIMAVMRWSSEDWPRRTVTLVENGRCATEQLRFTVNGNQSLHVPGPSKPNLTQQIADWPFGESRWVEKEKSLAISHFFTPCSLARFTISGPS